MVAAVVLTVSVEGPEPPVTDAGLSEQVGVRVPARETLQVKATALVKLLIGLIVIVEVEDPPAETVAGLSVEAEIVKSGIRATVRLTVASWLKDPEVPVTVMLEVAIGVTAVVMMVRVEVTAVAPGVTTEGPKLQLEPSGRPEQLRVTGLLKPLIALTEMV